MKGLGTFRHQTLHQRLLHGAVIRPRSLLFTCSDAPCLTVGNSFHQTRCQDFASQATSATEARTQSGTASTLEAAVADGAAALVLKKGKARLFWEGAPTVYSGAVEKVIGRRSPKTGDPVVLVDVNRKPLGWGVYNSESMFCLRVLQWTGEMQDGTALDIGAVVRERVAAAVALRADIGLPSLTTNIYRLINSEGDRLSGLVVDVFGTFAVAASSAAWVELNRSTIEAVLRRVAGLDSVTWRPSTSLLKLEGLAQPQPCSNAPEASGSGASSPHEGNGDSAAGPSHVTGLENGISYRVNLRHGQKTGFYADQRDSRALIARLSKGRKVLDLCCYSGGFALSAAAGGASSVKGVDSSEAAVSLARENAGMLGADCETAFVREECEVYMKAAAARGETWDIVVLDPPKLAPNKGALTRAKRKYAKLNAAALQLVAAGGLLMTCSCSGAVAQGEGLLPLVKEAAVEAGRKVALLRTAGAAMDHPLDPAYPEGRYLTNLLFRVT